MENKKILNVIPFSGRVSETFIVQRIEENIKMNFDNYIISDGISNIKKSGFIKINGRYKNKANQMLYYIKDIFNGRYNTLPINKTERIIKSIKPDIIHIHFGYQLESMFEVLNKIEFGGKVIVSFHGSDVLNFFPRNNKSINCIKSLVNQFDTKLVYPTKFLKDKFLSKCKINESHLYIVPNTFSSSFINDSPAENIKAKENIRLVNIARLVNWKGHIYILEGLNLFVKKYGDDIYLKLNIIGTGDELKKLKNYVNNHGLNKYVDFLGALEHHEVQSIMSQSNVFIHAAIKDPITNQEESFGISLLEAISMKLFCITTNTGGLKDVIGDNINDYDNILTILEEKDSNSVFSALEKLHLYGGNVNEEYVKERIDFFSIDRVNSLWENIYN